MDVQDRRAGTRRKTPGPSRRMKPARQTRRTPCGRSAATSAASYASRDGKSPCGSTTVGMPRAARERQPRRVRAIRNHDRDRRAQASRRRSPRAIAARLLPRPEIKTASFPQVGVGSVFHRFHSSGTGLDAGRLGTASALLLTEAPQCQRRRARPSIRLLLSRHQPRRRQGAALHASREIIASFSPFLREGLDRLSRAADRLLRAVQPLAPGRRPDGNTESLTPACIG